jgi:hypothetical protein
VAKLRFRDWGEAVHLRLKRSCLSETEMKLFFADCGGIQTSAIYVDKFFLNGEYCW